MFSVSTEVEDWLKILILFLFAIYLKVTITIYEKLPNIKMILALNPLKLDSSEWSNTLKQFACNSQRIFGLCLTVCGIRL